MNSTAVRTAFSLQCNECRVVVSDDGYITTIIYCSLCASIIRKNNSASSAVTDNYYPPECETCPSHPKNGGDGVCCCQVAAYQLT